jgi:two-component system response regulator YesN
MDINMPGINGIDAMKQIRAGNPLVSFIVISAFDYFDYAVEAVALGVEEYLLKPVKEVKFVETLNKILKRIEQNTIQRKKTLEQQERLEMIIPILEKGFMHSLCMYGEDTKELQSYSELLGYGNSGGYVMAIEFGQLKSQEDSTGHSGSLIDDRIDAGIQGEKMYEEYKNIIKSSFNCIISPILLNRIIVYIFDEISEESYEQKTESIRAAQKIIERAFRIYPDTFIGIGRYYENIQDAKKSYQEALHALRSLAALNKVDANPHSHILHEDDIIPKSEVPENDYEQIIDEEIYQRVPDNDEKSIQIAFEQLYDRMITDRSMNFDAVKKRMIGLVVGFGKRWGGVPSDDYYEVLSETINAGDKDKLFFIVKRYLNEALRQIVSSRQKKANSIIEKANQFIKDHYSEDISLEDVAKEVNLSSYYFSRFYKDMSGIGFSDKLVNIRIDKARELLKKEELTIKDVANMVGYMEPNYFSKIFKKATGITASDYKKMFGL